MKIRTLSRGAIAVIPVIALLGGCGPRRTAAPGRVPDPGEGGRPGEPVSVYHAMGFAAASGPVPFVAAVAHFAGRSPDTTLTLVTVSLSNRALTFAREGERYRASYGVELRAMLGDQEAARTEALETVRVASFREVGRTDESLIFHRWLRLVPGQYTLRLIVRDVGGSRAAGDSLTTIVPRLGAGRGGISTPIPVYDARWRDHLDTIPPLLARPRSTAVFGRDSLLPMFIEAYAPAGVARVPLRATVRNDAGVVVWSDSVSLPRHGAVFGGVVPIPVSQVGIGIGSVTVVRTDDFRDSSRAPLFVSFGEDLPAAPFEEMISYLRFYASASRLRALRDAPPTRRALVWAEFLRDTDPVPTTPEHEALQAYFARVQLANIRFREDSPVGWLSDRGSVFVALGEPDQIFDQMVSNAGSRRLAQGPVRIQVWEYRQQQRVQIAFSDEQQPGRFRFLPRSEAEFRAMLSRQLVQ